MKFPHISLFLLLIFHVFFDVLQLTVQKTAELESGDSTTATLLASYLAKVSPADYVNYSSVTAADVSNAAKASLAANPAYVVVGKTAGAHSFDAIKKLLK